MKIETPSKALITFDMSNVFQIILEATVIEIQGKLNVLFAYQAAEDVIQADIDIESDNDDIKTIINTYK